MPSVSGLLQPTEIRLALGLVGSAQQTGSKDKFVVGADGCAGGRNSRATIVQRSTHDRQGPRIPEEFLQNTGLFCRHIDAQKTKHVASLTRRALRLYVFIIFSRERKKRKPAKKMTRFSPARGNVGEKKGIFCVICKNRMDKREGTDGQQNQKSY